MSHQHLWENLQRTYHLHGRTIIYRIIFDIKTIKMKDTPTSVQSWKQKTTKLYISKEDWDTVTVPCHPCLRGLQMRGLLWWFCLAGYKSRRRRLTRRTRRTLRTRRTAHLTLNLTHLTRWFWIRSSLDSAGFFEWRPLNHWAICAQTKHDWTHIPLLRTDMVPLVVSRMSRMCGGRMAQKLSCRRQRCWRYWRLSELVQSDSANWLTRWLSRLVTETVTDRALADRSPLFFSTVDRGWGICNGFALKAD